MDNKIMRYISWYLVVAMFIIGITPKADAGLSPSEIITLQQVDRTADLQKIQKVIEVKAVNERLRQLGLTPDEIQKRLTQLSDQQLHKAALQLDNITVGQGDALGFIIAILVIVILVIVILKLTGHRVMVS
jgi:hypothetical protein